MEKKYEQLLSKLERELEKYVDMQPLERMRMELAAIRGALGTLKMEVETLGFSSTSGEIEFFKSIKPRFYSLLVLAAERYGYEDLRPARKGRKLEGFYIAQLDYNERFFNQHAFLYQ